MFNRLQQWENKLNSCIRCGYCLEHCPVFKYSRWESDAPRAKLAMLHAILNGYISMSETAAERIFECFYCKQCENSCSAGVPLTEIFTDARLDFVENGYGGGGTTVYTDTGRCVKCFACENICPHEARLFENGKMATDPVKCRGCGKCMDVCSARAIYMYKEMGTSSAEILRRVLNYFRERGEGDKIVIFGCNWSTYPGMQNTVVEPGFSEHDDEVVITMCTGRISTDLLITLLEKGAAGILIAGCPEDECDHKGSTYMKKKIPQLKQWMAQAGLDPDRIMFEEVPKGNIGVFQKARKEFIQNIRTA